MSLRNKRRNRRGIHLSADGFSSKSLGSRSIPNISTATDHVVPVTINKSLLTPLNIEIDPDVKALRTQEKEKLKGLNDKFISYINKVRGLEQKNKVLETEWKLLQGKTPARSEVEPLFISHIALLQKTLDDLNYDKEKLDKERIAMIKNTQDYKEKYEYEINKRSDSEMMFVLLKKDVDDQIVSNMALENQLSAESEDIKFLKAVYDEELKEQQGRATDYFAVVEMDNSRSLNMDQTVSEIKARHEDVTTRSKKETEIWYNKKFDQVATQMKTYESQLQTSKEEIAQFKRAINLIECEIERTKSQRDYVEVNITEVEQRGETAILDAKERIKDLEAALKESKQVMARQIRDYQKLMDVKLALAIEISTYRKLLEGEEQRTKQDAVINIRTKPTQSVPVENHQQKKSTPVLIKTVETQNRSYN